MGLTLDMDNQIVYWIVRSHLGSSLFSAKFMDLMTEEDEPIEYKLTERNLSGPLTHFSDRLVWRQNDKTIVFGDIQGKNLAFFENAEGKIIHVGIMLENQKIIHASGKVRIDTLDSTGIFNKEMNKHTHKLRVLKSVI